MKRADLAKIIAEHVEDWQWECEAIGIRTQEQPFEMGPIDHASQVLYIIQ